MDHLELSRASERGWRQMSNDGRTLPPLGGRGSPRDRGTLSHTSPTIWLRRRRRRRGRAKGAARRAVNPHGYAWPGEH